MGIEHIIDSSVNALAETAEKFNQDFLAWAKSAVEMKKGIQADDDFPALSKRLANSWCMHLEGRLSKRFAGLSSGEIAQMVAADGETVAKRLRIGGNIVLLLESGDQIYDAIKDNKNPNATIADLATEGIELVTGYVVGAALVFLIGESLLTVATAVAADIFLDDVLHALDSRFKHHYNLE